MLAIRSVSTLCVFCCVALGATRAGAEPPDGKAPPSAASPDLEEPAAVAKARAQLLFEKGVNAYREGHFYDAVDIFLETNRLYPDPKLSFNIAKALEGLGNQPGALRYYREYLRRSPDAPDKKEVDVHVVQLELGLSQKGLQQLTVLSTPEGATLELDGRAVAITPWTGESFAGKHRVVLEARGYRASERVIDVDVHRAQDFSFELTPLPKPAPARAPVAPPRAEPKVSALTFATLASGLVLLGTALVAQAVSNSNTHGMTRSSAFFAGGGAGVSVIGGFMLYFDLNPSGSSRASTGSVGSGLSFDGPGLEHSR